VKPSEIFNPVWPGACRQRSEGVSVAAWLAVQAGGRDYLLPLNQAGEIFPWTGVQPVPYTQAWFLGIANLRGALMGWWTWLNCWAMEMSAMSRN
jgi:hypothetical protein